MMRLSLVGAAAICAAYLLTSCQQETEPEPVTAKSQCNPTESALGRAPLRRLTRMQFTNALRTLFPSTQIPPLSLPNETLARGFENNADVQNPSVLFVEAHYNAVRQTVAVAMQNPASISPCLGGNGDDMECGRTLVRDFGRRAFRRPLSTEESYRYDTLFALGLGMQDVQVGASMVLEAMLQTPQFLYVPEFGVIGGNEPNLPLTSHEVAARLSLFLWDDLPDEELSAAADSDALSTPAAIEAQARRMLEDPRARYAVRNFHRQWLNLNRLENASKDVATFPMWNDTLRASMNEETLSFVERAIFDGQGTLNALLTSTDTRVDAALAEVYGVEPPASGWKNISLDPTERAGLLTLPGVLAAHGHPVAPSPVLRGVFILDRLLCSPPPAPPPGVETTISPAKPGEALTNRARYEAHVKDPVCASCHLFIDGAGFPFEQYDTLGRYRTTDNGFPVDSSGALHNIDIAGPVNNALELADRLATSNDVRRCVATQWFRYAFGRLEEKADACTVEVIDNEFAANGTDIRELILAIVRSTAFTHRPGGSGT